MKKKSLNLKLLLIIVFCICFYLWWNLYRSYHNIQINEYHFPSAKITSLVKLAVIGDLHSNAFGRNNEELIEKIAIKEPDAILMVGDMLDKDAEDSEDITALIERLKGVAPVYYAMGNHELEWMNTHERDLPKKLEAAGAVILDKTWCDMELKGQKLRIGGMYAYAFAMGGTNSTNPEEMDPETYKFLSDFQSTDAVTLMLAHRPDSFVLGQAAETWEIDLVLSGHLHGGQVVLPFLGGMYGGDQGRFPEYVHGLYKKDKINIFVSSGLSTNRKKVPRWNNPPEIGLIILEPCFSE